MLKDRIDAVRSVGERIIPHEQDLDAAYIRNCELGIAIVQARVKAKAPLTMGQNALRHVSQAAVCLAEARCHIHDAHMELRELPAELGVPPLSYGDYGATAAAPPAYKPTPLSAVA